MRGIKSVVLRYIKNLFFEYEKEKENYKPKRGNNFWSNNYIECKSNGDINKILSVEEYLNRIRTYLKSIINNLKKSSVWKSQLTITINSFSPEDDNDEEHVMLSKSDNIEIMISDESDEIIKNLFDSHKNRYQNNLINKR